MLIYKPMPPQKPEPPTGASHITPAARDAALRQWLEENQAAIQAWNNDLERAPLPLAELRLF